MTQFQEMSRNYLTPDKHIIYTQVDSYATATTLIYRTTNRGEPARTILKRVDGSVLLNIEYDFNLFDLLDMTYSQFFFGICFHHPFLHNYNIINKIITALVP
jgi:hypothetical protein